MILLNNAMDGQDTNKFPFSFFDWHGKYVETLLTTNKITDANGVIIGVFCFLQITNVENLLKVGVAFIFIDVEKPF
jgi:phytochrome B